MIKEDRQCEKTLLPLAEQLSACHHYENMHPQCAWMLNFLFDQLSFCKKSRLISQVTVVHPILCHHFAKSGLFNINSFDLEDNGSGAVIAAGNHDFIIICPSMHDRSALQCGINISADGVPCF